MWMNWGADIGTPAHERKPNRPIMLQQRNIKITHRHVKSLGSSSSSGWLGSTSIISEIDNLVWFSHYNSYSRSLQPWWAEQHLKCWILRSGNYRSRNPHRVPLQPATNRNMKLNKLDAGSPPGLWVSTVSFQSVRLDERAGVQVFLIKWHECNITIKIVRT